jgi:hypothetical protein
MSGFRVPDAGSSLIDFELWEAAARGFTSDSARWVVTGIMAVTISTKEMIVSTRVASASRVLRAREASVTKTSPTAHHTGRKTL